MAVLYKITVFSLQAASYTLHYKGSGELQALNQLKNRTT